MPTKTPSNPRTKRGTRPSGKRSAARAGGKGTRRPTVRKVRGKAPRKAKASSRKRWFALIGLVLAVAALWVGWPFWQIVRQFGSHPWQQPSRIYGRAQPLETGAAWSRNALQRAIEDAGYRRQAEGALTLGHYRLDGATFEISRRRFPSPGGMRGGDLLRIRLSDGAIADLTVGGARRNRAALDPPLVASFYGDAFEERRPVSVDELPEELIYAVLAAEDAGFLDHGGISVSGILRAAWANVRAGGVAQGGSTLTQQLVKNRYLSHKRTVGRKVREAVLAVLIDWRYEKRSILEAYLNEIYWGRSGSVNLMGVGAAAWAYFGKHPGQLDLAESALLAGIIRSPGSFSPRGKPERARAERDRILDRLVDLEWIDPARAEAAQKSPLGILDRSMVARRAPYFADAVAVEARERFGVESLRDTGYVLLTTLDPRDQRMAEEAVGWGVEALENGWEKDRKATTPLESALISIDPRTGGILAYVGGRDYGRSQFDRLSRAKRQAGSAFKPIVYAAAYQQGLAPASPVEDAPFTHVDHGRTWRPQNSDGEHRGWVTTRVSLAESLNVPTAKLALEVGLGNVIELAHRMGITTDISPYPALALGAMEVSPRELATVYATLASGGVRPPVHAIEAVFDRSGEPVSGRPLPPPARVLEPEIAYLVTDVLRDVLDTGTAKRVREQGIEDRLAGKTGTTNSRRDSWFAGYGPERVSLVWVGYDDNTRTQLSGARAAVPIWARFTYGVRPAGGYLDFAQPQGIVRAMVDPATGALATYRCTSIESELFTAASLPTEICPFHPAPPLHQGDEVEAERKRKRNPFRRWLDKIRKRDKPRGSGNVIR